MSMSSTYTLLVTIAHDEGAALSTELLEVMVQRGLEEGVRGFAGVHAATISALAGDAMRFPINATDPAKQAKKLHKALRAYGQPINPLPGGSGQPVG